MDFDYSVVIPAYNRADQLKLTLASFENQIKSIPFEVIVVNDASTDRTGKVLRDYARKAPYPFSVVSLQERSGPAVARNAGVKTAKGKYIIFCDADFLVLPNFIETHHDMHAKNDRAVVSGTPYCFKGIYSLYYPNFPDWEVYMMKQLLEKDGLWKDSFYGSSEILTIITEDDVRNDFDKIYHAIRPYNVIDDVLRKEFYDLSTAPWLLFITRNLSVEKAALESAGLFDERLIRGAGEDWELGYRLYRNGCKYVIIEKDTGFHQEHPNDLRKPYKNFVTFGEILAERFGNDDPEIFLLRIWNSSDELWRDIPVYKQAIRLFRGNARDSMLEPFKYLLAKACKR